MLDALHPEDDAKRPSRGDERVPQSVDREVPIEVAGVDAPAMAASLHAWLDGEGSEAAARRDARAGEVERWKRLTAELARRGEPRAPGDLAMRVMAAIGQD